MNNIVITIGREFGSGGRELGRRLSEYLGIAYYDKEIVEEIANRTQLSEKYVQDVVEHKPFVSYPIHTGVSFSPLNIATMQQKTNIYIEQANILKEMAEKSDCIIVGRCADYILRDYNPKKIFVYASMQSKMERCREKGEDGENLTDKQLQKYIAKIDKNRKAYYEFYTGQTWGDKLNYDLCINTTGADIKEIVRHVAGLIKSN